MSMTHHFRLEGQIRYLEVDQRQRATPVRIIEYLQEAAIAHSDAVGLSLERLASQGVGWVLRRWSLEMQRYPILGERFTVETWPSKFEHFNATREFRLISATGDTLGQASSHWIYLNVERKRPLRIPAEFADAYGLNPERAVDRPFTDLTPVDEPEISLPFTVRRSDIDTNNHVNNAKYVEWVLETIPQDVYDHGILTSLEIVYHKETTYGASVLVHRQAMERSAHTRSFQHAVVGPEADDLAMAHTVWRFPHE